MHGVFVYTAGLDFIASSGELTFHPGNTEKRFEVTIINDIMFEGLQVFSAELTTNDSRVDIFQTVATVQIIDTDSKNLNLITQFHFC